MAAWMVVKSQPAAHTVIGSRVEMSGVGVKVGTGVAVGIGVKLGTGVAVGMGVYVEVAMLVGVADGAGLGVSVVGFISAWQAEISKTMNSVNNWILGKKD
jgi:hypothetical protein